MLSEQNQKLLEEQFSSLPAEIQETILESNWKEAIRRVTEKYALHIDQGGALETIVFLTMLGLEEPANFTNNLKEEVRITESLALAITKEVEEEVFQKIRQDVMKKQSEDTAVEEDVDIVDEDGGEKDPYREVPEGSSKYVDGQHLDDESILREIEGGEHVVDGDRADIEIPKEVYRTKDVNIVEAPEGVPSITKQEGQEVLASVLDQKAAGTPDINLATDKTPASPIQQDINPLHIRTLKSDILRQKLENPSWTPEIDKKISSNTKDIFEKASAEALNRTSNPNPAAPGAPQVPQNSAPRSSNDPYRETF